MKIYNIEDNVYLLVNPKEKQYIGYDINDNSFFLSNIKYEESELINAMPDELRGYIFWTLFVAYGNSRYHNEHNNEIFDVFIKVLS
jgi:hypothetical protein